MKLIFVHDGPLFYDLKGNYYEFAYHHLLEKYSYIADKITFMMRVKPIEGEKKFTLVPKNIKVVEIPNFKTPRLYLKNRPYAEKVIKHYIKENDYVILRSQSSIAQIALKYVKKYNKPYIVESVGCSWDSYWNHSFLGKVLAPYMFFKTRKMIREADFVYYVTTEFLQKRYPTRGKSIGCSDVVLDSMDDTVLQTRLKKISEFSPERRLIVGTAAALDTRYKGQEYVIKAIKRLVKDGYNIEYWLAGGMTGSKSNTFLSDLAVKEGVYERVKFIGSLSIDKMSEYYDSLDIYIQPSKQEGLPRAVIEAMSRACPVIGTNIAGIPELIQKHCLFKKGSVKSFIKALKQVLNMELQTIAQENFNAAKKFQKEELQKKREMFYSEFMDNAQQKRGEK